MSPPPLKFVSKKVLNLRAYAAAPRETISQIGSQAELEATTQTFHLPLPVFRGDEKCENLLNDQQLGC